MSESAVDWTRLMNEVNSDDGLPKKVSVNMTSNAPVDWTRLIQEMNSDDEAPMRVSDHMMSASLHQKADPDPVGYSIKSKHSSSRVPAEGQLPHSSGIGTGALESESLIKAAKTIIALGSRDAEIYFDAREDRQASSDRQNGGAHMSRADSFRSGAKDNSISSLHHKPDHGLVDRGVTKSRNNVPMDKSCGVFVEDDNDDDVDESEAGDDDNSGTGYHLHHRRSGDQRLKDKAFSLNCMTMPRTCNCGNKCLSKATIIETIILRENYWGTKDEEAPSSKTRGLLNFQILSHSYSAALNDFQFCITNYDHSNVPVCEAAYLILLGYINTPNASHASNQWKRIKSWLKSTKSSDRSYDMYKADCDRKKRSLNEGSKIKLNHALTFVVNYAKEFGDRISSKEGSTGKEKIVAPLSTTKLYFEEYQLYCKKTQALKRQSAGKSTFSRALNYAYHNEGVRMIKLRNHTYASHSNLSP